VEQDGECAGQDRPDALTLRILHTSDWHAGKAWKGQSRLEELAAVLDDLAAAVEREAIDLVLMTGDVFDVSSPSAEAERLVFRFFRRVGQAGVPSVVIAGNHDSPARVEAWAQLAELALVTACGVVKPHDQGGCVRISNRSGEQAIVAMLPFVGPSQLLSAQELGAAGDEAEWTYARQMQRLVADISRGFRPDAVNLLLAHTHLEGALVGTSERRVHVAEQWAATVEMLPATAQYVALGHIHRSQAIAAAPVPTWYAGAPMQLDFGEEGEAKSYNLVEAHPGQPARVTPRPYVGARPLRTVTVPVSMFDGDWNRAETPFLFVEEPHVDVSERPHLRVIVDCTSGTVDPDINRKVRAVIPGVVSVDLLRPRPVPGATQPVLQGMFAPRDLYAAFLHQQGQVGSEAMLGAFDALYQASLVGEDDA
jgi:exonuclease SbcD